MIVLTLVAAGVALVLAYMAYKDTAATKAKLLQQQSPPLPQQQPPPQEQTPAQQVSGADTAEPVGLTAIAALEDA